MFDQKCLGFGGRLIFIAASCMRLNGLEAKTVSHVLYIINLSLIPYVISVTKTRKEWANYQTNVVLIFSDNIFVFVDESSCFCQFYRSYSKDGFTNDECEGLNHIARKKPSSGLIWPCLSATYQECISFLFRLSIIFLSFLLSKSSLIDTSDN